MFKNHLLSIFILLFYLVGCAGYKAEPVISENDKNLIGLRYYEPAPFLLIYSDGRGNLQSEILILPDLTKKMNINLYSYFANNNSTLTFEHGILKESKTVIDDLALPKAFIETIKTVGEAAIGTALNYPDSGVVRQFPAPYLFKIIIDKDGTKLIGGQGTGSDGKPLVININVTKTGLEDSPTGKK
jgi:hypothetical protein